MRFKLFLIFLLSIIFIIISEPVEASNNDEYALRLETIGIFQGTDNGFELDRAPTRIEGLVMFVRLLGEEEEAINGNFTHPFTDVPLWADSYVGYAYEHGYTEGISDDLFGTGDIKAISYLTFVLRALGYDDEAGDFLWSNAIEFSNQLGLIDQLETQKYQSTHFLRDDLAKITYNALRTNIKGDNVLLIDQLILNGKMNEQMKASLKFNEAIKTYESVSADNEEISRYWNDGRYIYYSNQQDNGYIYKFDRITMSNEKLLEIIPTNIFVYNNSLYYVVYDKKDNSVNLYTSDLTGKKQKLVKELPEYVCTAYIYKDKHILFLNDSLYSFDLKSNKVDFLANTINAHTFTILDDYVYLYDCQKESVIRINPINGSSTVLFKSSSYIYDIFAYENYLYYCTNSERELYRYDIISGKNSLIYDSFDEYGMDILDIENFKVYNDKIYLLMNMSYVDIYLRQLDLDGKNIVTLKEGLNNYSLYSSNGLLFYEFGNYFYKLTDDNEMELLEIDGSYITDIVESYDNAFYYVTSKDEKALYRYDPLTNETSLFFKSDLISTNNDIVYIYDENTILAEYGNNITKIDTRINDLDYDFYNFKGNTSYTFIDDFFYAVYTNYYSFEGIYRGDLINNEEILLTADSIFDYQIEDDGIYYTLFTNGAEEIKKVSLDGTNIETISAPSNLSRVESNGVDLYFANTKSFYQYNKTDKSFTKIYTSDSRIYPSKIINNKWYFSNDDNLYSFDISTSEVAQVSGGELRRILFANNHIYPSIYQIGIFDTAHEEFTHIK